MTSSIDKGNPILTVVGGFLLAAGIISLGATLGTLYALRLDAEMRQGNTESDNHTQKEERKVGNSDMREDQSYPNKVGLQWTILDPSQSKSLEQTQASTGNPGPSDQSQAATMPTQQYSEHKGAAQLAEEARLVAPTDDQSQRSTFSQQLPSLTKDPPRSSENRVTQARKRLEEKFEEVRRADAAMQDYLREQDFSEFSLRTRLALEIGIRCWRKHQGGSLQDACERNERNGWEQMQGNFGMPREIAAEAKARCRERHQSYSLQAACMRNEKKGLAELQGNFSMSTAVARKAKD